MKFPWNKYEELPLSKRNTLQIFITNRCNLKCDGCFARNVMADNSHGHDMTMAEYYRAVNVAIDKGAKQINILGGEPLLHPKLSEMCSYNIAWNLKTTVYTNGNYLETFESKDFHGAKIRVSLDNYLGTKKCIGNLIRTGFGVRHVDANYIITTETTIDGMLKSADILEDCDCKVFFIFNMQEMADDRDFFDCSGNKLILPVMKYKKLIHEFLEMYNGNMEIHFSKRGVFESTLSLPHNKCKFANYFIGGKIIQCPYDIINLKYQDDYEYDTRFCQQNSTCLMSKIKLQRKK